MELTYEQKKQVIEKMIISFNHSGINCIGMCDELARITGEVINESNYTRYKTMASFPLFYKNMPSIPERDSVFFWFPLSATEPRLNYCLQVYKDLTGENYKIESKV